MKTLDELTDEVRAAARGDDWATVTERTGDIADLLWDRREREAAVQQYLVEAIFRLQGATDVSSEASDLDLRPVDFDPSTAYLRSRVPDRIARFLEHTDATIDVIEETYSRITDDVWLSAFPRSKADVWATLQRQIASSLGDGTGA